jgi:hypothetical protein
MPTSTPLEIPRRWREKKWGGKRYKEMVGTTEVAPLMTDSKPVMAPFISFLCTRKSKIFHEAKKVFCQRKEPKTGYFQQRLYSVFACKGNTQI